MIDFCEVSNQLPKSDLINAALYSLKEAESDAFFAIAVNKAETHQKKQSIFKGQDFKNIYVVSNKTNFGQLSSNIASNEITHISPNFFLHENFYELKNRFEKSLVIMTNNIFAEIGAINFSKIYQDTPNTVYAIHDYDNHHWLQNSIQIALLADVYIPAHQENYLICSRLNPNVIGGIPCGSNQWSMDFIKNLKIPLHAEIRKDDPLGKYYFYEKFVYRNKVIRTLESTYPSITILHDDFHSLTQEQKWNQWVSHKLHWIIPVLNDLPIRFFDALLTGGMPLVPSGLIPQIKAIGIPKEFYSSYGPLDILEPKKLVEVNLRKFEALGKTGIVKRHQYALQHFHIDQICEKIIQQTINLYRQ